MSPLRLLFALASTIFELDAPPGCPHQAQEVSRAWEMRTILRVFIGFDMPVMLAL